MRRLFPLTSTLFACLFFTFLSPKNLSAQDILSQAEDYIRNNLNSLGLLESDLDNWVLQNHIYSEHNGLHHLYWKQSLQGIPVEAAMINLSMLDNGEVLSVGNRFVADLLSKQSGSSQIDAATALMKASRFLEIPLSNPQSISVSNEPNLKTFFDDGGLGLEPFQVEKIYISQEEEVRLSWKVQIYLKDASKWWAIYVDAESGEILLSRDQVLHCSFEEKVGSAYEYALDLGAQKLMFASPAKNLKIHAPDSYRVYPLGIESPNHGGRSLISKPADLSASPYGWHDTDGSDGAEFTTTQGNNVLAAEDKDGDNVGGFSPDGGGRP